MLFTSSAEGLWEQSLWYAAAIVSYLSFTQSYDLSTVREFTRTFTAEIPLFNVRSLFIFSVEHYIGKLVIASDLIHNGLTANIDIKTFR
jgi:hypothetical protein